jgi:hypothetical protein
MALQNEIYTRKIKTITGNGSTKIKITPTPGKRLFNVQLNLTYSGGTNTLAALMTALTEIRVKVGTKVRWRLTGTQLRDFCLLRGATYDFNGLPNSGAQVTIPLSPEWFLPQVQDLLAWNPAVLGGDITIELDSTATLTVTNAYERTNDNLAAASVGILTMELINPVAGGTAFFVSKEVEPSGQLISASIYPDSGASNEITPASLYVGRDDTFAFETLSSTENDEQLERYTLTPSASGRTANVYDMVFVKDDGLARAIDLATWGTAKFKVEAASAMSGTVAILLARLENK